MPVWPVLLMVLASAAPPAEITTLNGEQQVGNLERITAEGAVLKTPTGSATIPAGELLKIRLPGIEAPVAATTPMFEVVLTDNSLLRVSGFISTATEAILKHPQFGEVKLPLKSVHSVRFAQADAKIEAGWKELLAKPATKDQVAVRKNDVIDHLDGVIGPLDDTTLKFQLDGDEIPVKRERVFGLIYAKREVVTAKSASAVELNAGDRLLARSVSFEADAWNLKLVSGLELAVPVAGIQSVDYTLGKIEYLSNLKPRDVKYVPFFDFVWEYRRDRGFEGHPLTFGTQSEKKTYAKGLAIHSVTNLKYRIGGDYRRFQAVMGIDDHIPVGNVDVTIKGDGRTLFKGTAKAGQAPQVLDLDVNGVVELEINVGYGEDELDIGDRLHLADAKLVK